MLVSVPLESPPCGFKISIPLGDEVDSERRLFQLNIQSFEKWYDELYPKRRANKVPSVCQITGEQDGQWTITNGSFEVDSDSASPASSPTDKPATPNSPDSPQYTLEGLELLIPGCMADESEEVDTEVLKDRAHALEILEGKVNPPPNRDYEGKYAEAFRGFADEEEQAKKLQESRDKIMNTPFFYDDPKGWKFLHDLISSGRVPTEGSVKFPVHRPDQRAFLLNRDNRAGTMVTVEVRNLDACSRLELFKLMKGVEKRGWVDMIYVAKQDEDIPRCFPQKGEIEVLKWGGVDE
ncbi:hypothetical protein BKA59DRAFT_77682 [Fusarium tricinctum]|uniref:Uncharacterized protein n=1 Tax=Fusarium tricinctum TaxID=61284 RepID=A0A8K0S725_9HYPO|nr:hypothetical protein BKA59DRAFT_77682 [Fusarium tricinctum]